MKSIIPSIKKALEKKEYERIRSIMIHELPYFSEIQKSVRLLSGREEFMNSLKDIRISVLGSFTVRNIDYVLRYMLIANGFRPDIMYGEYNQYVQELIDDNSQVYSFKPDIVVVALDSERFFDSLEYQILEMKREEIEGVIKNKIEYLESSLSASSEKLKSRVILTNLLVPGYMPGGIADAQNDYSYMNLVRRMNEELVRMCNRKRNVTLIDIENAASKIGKNRVINRKMYYAGKILLSEEGCKILSREIVKVVNAVYGNVKKCLVLDLDNSLWGGVVGEDGPLGINIGEEGAGYAFKEAQKVILNYYRRGIILAINSKNNEEDVWEAFEKNRNMVLKKEHFAAYRINWNDKASNIVEIARELNIGVDSMVFIDDNPAERGLVREALPSVLVPDFPDDPADIPEMLKNLDCFDVLSISDEDRKRNEMYAAQKKRENEKRNFANLTDYLKDLRIRISFSHDSMADIERITQLINKTNQFNVQTNRYTLEKVREMIESSKYIVYSMRVWDKFGELGLTGVAIASIKDSKDGKCADITDFLMSCRIMGRLIEREFIRHVVNDLRGRGVSRIVTRFIPTKKNSPVRNFFEKMGFAKFEERNGAKEYELTTDIKIKPVEWIVVEGKGEEA